MVKLQQEILVVGEIRACVQLSGGVGAYVKLSARSLGLGGGHVSEVGSGKLDELKMAAYIEELRKKSLLTLMLSWSFRLRLLPHHRH